jgi:hypothetical protein
MLGILFAIVAAAGSFAADRVGSAQYDIKIESSRS